MELELSDKHRIAIRVFMAKNNLKTSPWCNKAEVAEGTLRSFLKGDTQSMKIITLKKLAKAANTTVNEIIGDEGSGDSDVEKRLQVLERGMLQLATEIGVLTKRHPRKKSSADA